MQTEESFSIKGTHYKVMKMPARKAARASVRLFKILGPSLSRLIDAAAEAKSIKDIKMAHVSAAISDLSAVVSEEDLNYFLKVAFEDSLVSWSPKNDGKWPIITEADVDIVFVGKVGELFQLLVKVFQVNYSDFLGDLGGMLPSLKTQTP